MSIAHAHQLALAVWCFNIKIYSKIVFRPVWAFRWTPTTLVSQIWNDFVLLAFDFWKVNQSKESLCWNNLKCPFQTRIPAIKNAYLNVGENHFSFHACHSIKIMCPRKHYTLTYTLLSSGHCWPLDPVIIVCLECICNMCVCVCVWVRLNFCVYVCDTFDYICSPSLFLDKIWISYATTGPPTINKRLNLQRKRRTAEHFVALRSCWPSTDESLEFGVECDFFRK